MLSPNYPMIGPSAAASPGLTSIIIPCHNQVAYTQLCVDSLHRHTRPAYELIFIDNGSTDETAASLHGLAQTTRAERVVVLRNEGNVGFPAACNQGFAAARGDAFVLLNNDTVVTPGWLEGLLEWSRQYWPAVGMVGPVSNGAPPPQYVAAGYADLSELEAFACGRAEVVTRQALDVPRLTGFCLLIRRAVLTRVGGLDESFGQGFFEDDDLCVRVRRAGFRLLLARDVYIHHFGNRTFDALGVDKQAALQRNFERFAAKWPEEATHYRLPGIGALAEPVGLAEDASPCASRATVPASRQRVSLTMIVKNEEKNLPECLTSVADLVDELVVVDTGSGDATREIARRFGARVVDFPWVDSFAAARNESLRHATGDWIFWMDADDRLDELNRGRLQALLGGLKDENAAFVMKCRCLPDPVTRSTTVVDHVRLFRNQPEIRWKYRVHEQIIPAIRAGGGDVRFVDVVIDHTGYQDPALRARKLERDLRLLGMNHQEEPGDPFVLYNLGHVHLERGDPAAALPGLVRSLELSHPADSIVRKLYALIAVCRQQLHQPAEALSACQAGRRFYPDDVELLFHEGVFLEAAGRLEEAAGRFRMILDAKPATHFASIDTGIGGCKARAVLARILTKQGRLAEAVAEWRSALDDQPDQVAGWQELADLLFEQERFVEVETLLDRLDTFEADFLRCRMLLARKAFTDARQLAGRLIASRPEAYRPRVLLTHVLLQEDSDRPGAERALLDTLTLRPNDAEALHNLAVLRNGRAAGPAEEAVGTPLTDLHESAEGFR